MNNIILEEIPSYAIEDCKSLQKCANCLTYRLPLSLAYTIYHKWSEEKYCAGWTGNAFNCFTFITLMNFIEQQWVFTEDDRIVDDGSYPIEILEDAQELYYWIMNLDGE